MKPRVRLFYLLMGLISAFVVPLTAQASAFRPEGPLGPPPPPVLTYSQALSVTTKLTTMWNAIPAADKQPVITDVASANRWLNEVLPYFESEGVNPNPVVPKAIEFQYWPTDSDYAEHTLGTTGICGDIVTLNKRLITPGDPWMASDESLLVLTHELVHIQGVCSGNGTYNDEQSAQIISWEILAAMSNAGFLPARVSLLADLRNRAFGMTEQLAKQDGKLADWHRARLALCDGTECAQQDRSDRIWATNQTEQATLLANYYTVPMSAWVLALQHGCVVHGVLLPLDDVFTKASDFSVAELAAFWAQG